MTTTVDVDRLRAAAAAAAQKAADAAARVAAAAAAETAERERRAREWDERVLDSFDEAVLREASAAALRTVHEAVVEGGDVFAAWMQYQVAHRRLFERVSEANAAAARLGRPLPGGFVSSVHEDLNAVVKTAVSEAAARRVADELDERDAERERFIAGMR